MPITSKSFIVLSSSGARTSVFALGDSLTLGYSGISGADSAGGWRTQLTTPVNFKGPYSNFGNHGGVNGNQFADMEARFNTDWTGNEADEIWVLGGANGVNDGLNATQCATALGTLLDVIYAAAPGKVVRVFTVPFLNYVVEAKDAVLNELNRRFAQVIADDRASGNKVYLHDVGDPIQDASHLDGQSPGGLEHPINSIYGIPGVGTGYGLMANRIDRYLVSGTSIEPDGSLSGLTLQGWWRADTVSGDDLTDRSGNGRTITLFNTPTATTGINSVAKYIFNGTSQYGRSATDWTIDQPTTVLLICRPTAVTGGPAMLDGATTSGRNAMFCSTGNILQIYAGSFFNETLVAPTTITHAYMVNYNSTSSKLWFDGVPRRQTINPNTNGANGFTIMASAATTPSNFCAGDFYELALFSGTPDDEEVVFGLHKYIQERYNLWPILGETTTW